MLSTILRIHYTAHKVAYPSPTAHFPFPISHFLVQLQQLDLIMSTGILNWAAKVEASQSFTDFYSTVTYHDNVRPGVEDLIVLGPEKSCKLSDCSLLIPATFTSAYSPRKPKPTPKPLPPPKAPPANEPNETRRIKLALRMC
ncbi:hypothetical protein ACH5RR_039999 [Cinchona calisaya]|uniref:Uncharacterized protein n=1 Tax=Cinchona calisaya TaxID=153742 RepID=A0ABD2Y2D4_9GENT